VRTASSNSMGPGMSNVGCEACANIFAVVVDGLVEEVEKEEVEVEGEVEVGGRGARCCCSSPRRLAVEEDRVAAGRGMRGGSRK
jgi:hypothetical protein